MTAVGIDFGTTNSVVATWSHTGVEVLDIDHAPGEWAVHGFSKVMPSVFAVAPDGRALFGWAAKRAESRPFEAVKRLFATQQETVTDAAGTTLAVEEVATMLFAQLKQGATNSGVPASTAVITVPANSRGLARHRTKVCAGMAGLEVMALLNEPTAAAMAYAIRHPGDQQILVFDWGGGTLDVTILRSVAGVFMEQASKGLPTSGGMDLDSRLMRAVIETVPDAHGWGDVDRHRFRLNIELAKIELSSRDETELQLPGGDTRRLTRAMFENAVQPLVEEAQRPLRQCLGDIGAGPGVIDAVVMVGGTSKIPLVRRFVAELLGQEPVSSVDPMTAVGEGAAIAAAILSGKLDTNDFFVSTEHALGTITHDPTTGVPQFSVLVPRNHKLPASRTERFSPLFEGQEQVAIQVIEGDPQRPVDDPDSVILTSFEVTLPDAGRYATDQSFDITYEYDVDGILHVRVNDPTSGDLIGQHEVSFGITEDKRALVRMAKRAQSSLQTGELLRDAVVAAELAEPEVAALLQRAYVKVIPFLDGEEASHIRLLADRLRDARPTELAAAKQELQVALAPYPYLF